jgi:hypothetical protein
MDSELAHVTGSDPDGSGGLGTEGPDRYWMAGDGQGIDAVRPIRDEIERVRILIGELLPEGLA